MDNLKYLLSVYFNQDWMHEANSSEGVVHKFVVGEDENIVRNALDELRDLIGLGKTESDLKVYLTKEMGAFYYPGKDRKYSDWLAEIHEQIARELSGL